jgi:hypothetical protein
VLREAINSGIKIYQNLLNPSGNHRRSQQTTSAKSKQLVASAFKWNEHLLEHMIDEVSQATQGISVNGILHDSRTH